MWNTGHQQFFDSGGSFGRVAVLYGGTSAEREISLRSGAAVAAGLREKQVDVVEIDIGENAIGQLQAETFDRVFIALHGAGGEDGKIQAVLDLMGVPYTGSRHTASAIAMDKLKTKQIWQTLKLPTPGFSVLRNDSEFAGVLAALGGDVFVKPIHEGSSIGMRATNTFEGLKEAYSLAAQYDSQVLVETRIVGAEFSVGLLGGKALPPIKLETDNAFYDYEAKYFSNETRYLCPCGLSEDKTEELKLLAEQAFDAIGCSGWGRVDVMQNKAGDFFLLEVNTVPGMTDHSLVPMAAKAVGMSFSDLVCEILMQTLSDR